MGHNLTIRKRTALIMRSPLSDYAGWTLHIDCGGSNCPRDRAYDVQNLVGMYRGVTVSDAIRRLRCSNCGCSPNLARLRPKPGTAVRLTEVALVGPGSN